MILCNLTPPAQLNLTSVGTRGHAKRLLLYGGTATHLLLADPGLSEPCSALLHPSLSCNRRHLLVAVHLPAQSHHHRRAILVQTIWLPSHPIGDGALLSSFPTIDITLHPSNLHSMDPMRTSHHPPHPPPLSTGPRVEQNHHPTQQPTWRTSPESRSSHLSGPASRNDHSPPGPADYGARHQRHVSHSDAGYRQWSSGPSNSFSGPSPTGSTSYDKRRNSYGSTAPQGHVDPYLPAPHDVEVDSPSRTVRRESHDILHQPQQHLASGGGRLGGSPPSLYRGKQS